MSSGQKLFSFPANKWIDFKYDANPDWQQAIFSELIGENLILAVSTATYQVELQIKRKSHEQWKEMVLVRGKIVGDYTAACIRCLAPTPGAWDQQLKVVFLSPLLEGTPDFVDLEQMLIENEEWDLHYYHRNEFSLQEIIREELVVGLPLYPLHSPDCQGLCPVCGEDLNQKKCSHGE